MPRRNAVNPTADLPRTKKEVVTEFRCKSILEAARSVFARRGFTAALMDDIADEAGVAKGTVYLYFRSKEEIYLAALIEELRRFHRQTLRAVEAVQGARQKIRAFAEVGLENCQTHGDFLRIYLSAFPGLMPTPSRLPKELAAIHKERVALLAAIIDAGIRAKEIQPVPVATAASTVFYLFKSMWERKLLDESGGPPQKDLEFVLDFIWHGLAPR